jgi:UDP-N-acetyl-D-glucosamine dehydrogenase
MTKLLENTFRVVNIGLINEMAIVARALNIDIWEVIEAASTKPFGFMPFYPGPGVGGHCIGIDPVYLAWKAKHHGEEVQFVDLARRVNARMPEYIVERIVFLFNQKLKKKLFGAKILVLGVSYKKDVPDVRESPAFEIISRLEQLGAHVVYHDPYVRELNNDGRIWRSHGLNQKVLRSQDLVLLLTDHSKFDQKLIVGKSEAIFDTRNALKNFRLAKIHKL